MPVQPPITSNIDYQKMIELHNEYVSKKHPKLKKSAGNKDDTKSVWFERDASLISFLNDILSDTNVTGLRIYLCAYKDKVDTTDPTRPLPAKQEYLKRLTVGLVATKIDTLSGKQVDYPDPTATGVNSHVFMAPPQNHGELCPPDICP